MPEIGFQKMNEGTDIASTVRAELAECNCLAIRQAARHVTQFYDQLFAPAGLRATQFAILSRPRRQGAMTIGTLAGLLVTDRTTLGRNILPLQRDGLIEAAASPGDRRRRELRLADAGLAKHAAGLECWSAAQQRFEATFGGERAAALRRLLREVVTADFTAGPGVNPGGVNPGGEA
jgi:DNA-binding MarR family transcriptional regulator